MDVVTLQKIVDDYAGTFPNDADALGRLYERLKLSEQFNHRKSFSGHGTGSAIVLSPDMSKVLLIHHLHFDKWFQPGGHWDPEDPDPWTTAQREAEEEAGIVISHSLHVDPDRPHIPLDLNMHHVPANDQKSELEHDHYDFRYAFVASSEEGNAQLEEVAAFAWVPLDTGDDRLQHIWKSVSRLKQLGLIA